MRLIASHECVDENGNPAIVDEYQTYRTVRTLTGSSQIPGLKELRLRGGGFVNAKEDGTFQVVQDGRILRRVE